MPAGKVLEHFPVMLEVYPQHYRYAEYIPAGGGLDMLCYLGYFHQKAELF